MDAFLSFLLNKKLVKEWMINFRGADFIPSVVNLRIVYAFIILFRAAFTFLEKLYENMYVFVRTCNNLIETTQM